MRRLALCFLLALAAIGVGGAVDYEYGIRARADLGGTEPARILEVLQHDPDVDIVRTFPQDDGVDFWCSGHGTMAYVDARRSQSVVVRVDVINRHPTAEEVADWNRLVDDICARIDDTCPEVGAWDRTREPEGGAGWMLLTIALVGLLCLAGATVAVVLLVLKLDRWMSAALR